MVADHGAAMAIAPVMVAAVVADVAIVAMMAALLVMTATVVIAALRIGAAGHTDGRGEHADGGKDRLEAHGIILSHPERDAGQYACERTSFLSDRGEHWAPQKD